MRDPPRGSENSTTYLLEALRHTAQRLLGGRVWRPLRAADRRQKVAALGLVNWALLHDLLLLRRMLGQLILILDPRVLRSARRLHTAVGVPPLGAVGCTGRMGARRSLAF